MRLNELAASKIEDYRVSLGLNCEFVANQIGISKGAYRNMVNGKVEISIARLELISKSFNNPLESFIPTKGGVTQISNGSGHNVSQEGPCNIVTQNNFPQEEFHFMKNSLIKIEKTLSETIK
ncbi:MAG: helix-turn-helix transcriptional regulator [Saprospiraceae bacterium]|nr:helix-turn-helix transcriptional regulator [Saprospiraceae bacterium]